VLEARAELLAAAGKRTWEISPGMPALVIIIDEYAELADEAPGAMSDTDSIARLGRAVAVTLIAATQRPTQKAMGQGAVRSQMDLRVCFRVREPRDVDLILGQGMLRAGWDAHNLNAPGKFLVSAPGHDRPKRARAYLLADQVVTETAARYADYRPALDAGSRRAILAAANARPNQEENPTGYGDSPEVNEPPVGQPTIAEETLWMALRMAPDEGTGAGDLMRVTGMTRSTIYRHLREYARTGHVVQVSRGHWRARTMEES
jgi:S-DNA-T family DNA segregation ATPase FtsK/SpoIIIE